MALFRKTKPKPEEPLSEPPQPLDIHPVKKLATELEQANSIDLSAHTTLDSRVKELESAYKSNKILGKKIIKELDTLRTTLDNIKEHSHIIQLQKSLEKAEKGLTDLKDTTEKQKEHMNSDLKSIRTSMETLSSKEELKTLQEKTKQGFKEAEDRFANKKKFASAENQILEIKERLADVEIGLQKFDDIEDRLRQQVEEVKRLFEIVELLSKKMVM